jgi:raffinose/stachyose/melibiose transport system permease protein
MVDATIVAGATANVAAPAHRRRQRAPMRWFVLALLVLLLIFTLFPFLLALLNAFKPGPDYLRGGPLSIPSSIQFDSILKFWRDADYTRKLFNSALISAAVSLLAVAISLFNAYALGIGRVRGSVVILAILLLGTMVPQESIIYPIYWMAKSVGLYDTQLSVIIVLAVLQSAFGTYLLSSVMSTFPREILEAAEIDGATRWQVLTRVVVPVMGPTLTVLGTFFFIWTWNEFLIPVVMLVSNNNQTVAVAMGLTRGQNMSDPTLQAAAGLLGILPTVIFFLIFQRTLTRGVIAGAVK